MVPTSLDKILTWEGATFVPCLMVDYEVNFSAIFWYELHDKAFRELANLLFSYIIQRIYDTDSMPEIPGVN